MTDWDDVSVGFEVQILLVRANRQTTWAGARARAGAGGVESPTEKQFPRRRERERERESEGEAIYSIERRR